MREAGREKKVADVLNCQGNGPTHLPQSESVSTPATRSPRVGRRNALSDRCIPQEGSDIVKLWTTSRRHCLGSLSNRDSCLPPPSTRGPSAHRPPRRRCAPVMAQCRCTPGWTTVEMCALSCAYGLFCLEVFQALILHPAGAGAPIGC